MPDTGCQRARPGIAAFDRQTPRREGFGQGGESGLEVGLQGFELVEKLVRDRVPAKAQVVFTRFNGCFQELAPVVVVSRSL